MTELPTKRELLLRVAEAYGVTADELRGPSREHRLTQPRHRAFALFHETGRFSLPAIGAYFGGRHHTTVLHGIRTHAARVEGRRYDRVRPVRGRFCPQGEIIICGGHEADAAAAQQISSDNSR